MAQVPQPPQAPGQQPAYAPGSYPPQRRTSGLAIASLVLGIVGIFLFVIIIPSLLAVIFGLVSLPSINRSGGAVGGKGMAIAGVVLGALELILLIALLASNGGSFSYHFGS